MLKDDLDPNLDQAFRIILGIFQQYLRHNSKNIDHIGSSLHMRLVSNPGVVLLKMIRIPRFFRQYICLWISGYGFVVPYALLLSMILLLTFSENMDVMLQVDCIRLYLGHIFLLWGYNIQPNGLYLWLSSDYIWSISHLFEKLFEVIQKDCIRVGHVWRVSIENDMCLGHL